MLLKAAMMSWSMNMRTGSNGKKKLARGGYAGVNALRVRMFSWQGSLKTCCWKSCLMGRAG